MTLRRQHPPGIALVITLIMLSVVTLMAVTFLAISRRERAAVTVSSDQADAQTITEMARARAEAEIVARVQAVTNLLNYDLLVSTNFILGFLPADGTNLFNVGYTRRGPGTHRDSGPPIDNEDDLLRMLANLQLDPRAPVFVPVPRPGGGTSNDFRFYLDLNRNGHFETNGVFIGTDRGGVARPEPEPWVGDPEWIGVLRRPDLPHSGTNPFVGRYAYLVLPAGKTLDANFIHNNAKRGRAGPRVGEGFLRNQGIGSYELNFAGFLRELNSNAWAQMDYNYVVQGPTSAGEAFRHAYELLHHRHGGSLNNLAGFNLHGSPAAGFIERDGNDLYSDGDLMRGITRTNDNDRANTPWQGSDNPRRLHEVDELLTIPAYAPPFAAGGDSFTNLLFNISRTAVTYNRHTFYRLLAQLGVDSTPANRGRLNLNFDNRLDLRPAGAALEPSEFVGWHATNFVRWQPLAFFTNAADLMIRASLSGTDPRSPLYGSTNLPYALTNLSATYIPVWPVNWYTPSVHRLLQLAANLYDATQETNAPGRAPAGGLLLPSVFRPIITQGPVTNSLPGGQLDVTPDGLVITGWSNVTTDWRENVWDAPHVDLDQRGTPAVDTRIAQGVAARNLRVAGLPLVIGARRGYPNFNEFAMQSDLLVTRKLEVAKASIRAPLSATNQLYGFAVSNIFGVELWNSYGSNYPRGLELRVRVESDTVVSNQYRALPLPVATNNPVLSRRYEAVTNLAAGAWRAGEFLLPVYTNQIVLGATNQQGRFTATGYRVLAARAGSAPQLFPPLFGNVQFEFVRDFETPVLDMYVTNRVRAILVDTTSGFGERIVDYVDLDNLNAVINITRELIGNQNVQGESSIAGSFWRTNRTSQGFPEGVLNQFLASSGSQQLSLQEWNSSTLDPVSGNERAKATARFRAFIGLAPQSADTPPEERLQMPFSPARRLFLNKTWQVNDPLVNDLAADVVDPLQRNPSLGDTELSALPVKPVLGPAPTFRNNLRQTNFVYSPWADSLYSSADANDFDLALKDPQITRSDDWRFPTNTFPNLGWIGRVHRGTPWQTVFLKSGLSQVARAGGALPGAQAAAPTLSAGDWYGWSGHRSPDLPPGVGFGATTFQPPGTHPTNDWRLLDLFTVAPNDNAARGLLSVNQDGAAAWSAVFSGVPALHNSQQGGTNFFSTIITPGSPQFSNLVAGINAARAARPTGRFNYLGEILATPELSDRSPYLRLRPARLGVPRDEVVERLPQQILGLLKPDEPRFVIYAYGQSLRPAPNSVIVAPGPYFQMATNYQITGEYGTKTVLRLEGSAQAPRAVVESFSVLPPPE